MTRKIAIIGRAPASRMLAPYDDPSWEIWTLSPNGQTDGSFTEIPRFDVWFEIHPLEEMEAKASGYIKWLASIAPNKMVVLREPHESIPDAVIYPTREIVAKFGTYLTNTVSLEIAYALHVGCDELGLWGVDMAQYTEYSQQRPSCEYLIGWARGMGIPVTIPPECDLLKTARIYGIEDMPEIMGKVRGREEELKGRIAEAENARDQAMRQGMYLHGRLSEINELEEFIRSSNGQAPQDIEQLFETLADRRKNIQTGIDQTQALHTQFDRGLHMLLGAKEDLEWAKQWAV